MAAGNLATATTTGQWMSNRFENRVLSELQNHDAVHRPRLFVEVGRILTRLLCGLPVPELDGVAVA